MRKRIVVSTLGKTIGELEVDGVVYPLLAPNGYIAQEIDVAGDSIRITDAYRLVGRCAPSMPEEVLLSIGVDTLPGVLEEIKDAILGITREVLPDLPKAPAVTTS